MQLVVSNIKPLVSDHHCQNPHQSHWNDHSKVIELRGATSIGLKAHGGYFFHGFQNHDQQMLQRLQKTQNTSVCFRCHGISRDTLILKLVKKAFGIGHWLIFLVEALRLDRAWRATEHFHRFQPLQSTYWYAPPQGGWSKPSSQPWSLFPLLEGFAGPFFSVSPLTSFLLATPSYIAKSLVEVKQEECPFPPC